MRFRILRVLSILLAMGLPLLGVSHASADTLPWSDTVDVTGHAAVVIPNPTVPPTVTNEPFTVDTVTACHIWSDPLNNILDPNSAGLDSPAADGTAGDDCKNNFTASGTVHDTFCGTGKVDITFKVYELKHTTPAPAYEDSISGTINNVQFVAGQATNVNVAVTETEPLGNPPTGNTSYTAQASGTIDAVPDDDTPGVDPDDPLPLGDGDCTDGFTFHAHLLVTEGSGAP